MKTWLAQHRKAIVAFIVPNIPAVIAFVTARWGAGVAAEVVAVAAAFGVHLTPNDTPPGPKVGTITISTITDPKAVAASIAQHLSGNFATGGLIASPPATSANAPAAPVVTPPQPPPAV